MLTFYIVVPVFNEAPRIPELISRLREYGFFEKTIFVDDGSTDGTGEIIKKSGGFCLTNVSNFGKGYSQRKGFEEALRKGADFVLTMDGDLQHDPKWIPLLIKEFTKGFDIVIGSRWNELHKMPRDRYLSNRLTTLAISLLTRKRLQDTQSGFRAYSRWILEKIYFNCNKFEAESELLIKAVLKGAKVGYIKIPALYYTTSHSKIKRSKDTLRFLKMYFKIAFSRS
jgi:glycosyltransferase involved in cell wall biosynthesis